MTTSGEGSSSAKVPVSENKHNQAFLFFLIEEQKYALGVSCVQTVIPAVEITPVEGASEFLLGVINLRGSILPVLNMRKRLDLPAKSLDLSDRIIVVNAPLSGNSIRAAIPVDQVEEVVDLEENLLLPLSEMIRKTNLQIEHLIKIEGDLIKVYHLTQLFSLDVLKLDLQLIKLPSGVG